MIPTAVAHYDLTADTGTPAWLTHALTVAIPAVAVVLSIWQPSHTLSTPGAQAAVILGGLLIAAFIHLGHLFATNGLTKAGILRTVSEEEAWLKANVGAIRSTFEAARPALDAIGGVPAALATAQADLEQVKAKVDAIPTAQRQAVIDVLGNLTGTTAAIPVPGVTGVTLTGSIVPPPAVA